MEWEATQCEDWKQKLTTYNLEDCAALKKVVEVVQAIIAKACSEPESPVSEQGQPPIAFVKDEKMDYPYNLGTVNFFHPDYEYINNCAYFDYQRKKVYVRTSNALKKKKSGKKKLPNKKLRVSNHVMIKASSCPTCKSRKIIGGVKREKWSKGSNVKRAFDLVLTPGGIRRKVIEVRASIHQCLNCDKKFIPPAYQRLDKHFHSLKSWAMFQHVEYSISFEAISRMFEEFFSLRVLTSEIHEFKSFLARYYKTTYKNCSSRFLR
jgi:hypothetical protein